MSLTTKTTALAALVASTAFLAVVLGSFSLCGGAVLMAASVNSLAGQVAGGVVLAIGMFAAWNGVALFREGFAHFRGILKDGPAPTTANL